jgi:hypothetical protein
MAPFYLSKQEIVMKKTIFLGIAALLTLAVFSCSDPSLPKADNAEGISLNIVDSSGRALVGTTAEAGTNFYEAAFKNTTNAIIRTTWNYARKGKIQIEPDTYTVIIMAGRNADKTLLGVGRPSSIKDDGTTTAIPTGLSVTITPTTTDLTFTVYPLLNDIRSTVIKRDHDYDSGTTDIDMYSTFETAITTTYPLLTTKDELGNAVPVFMITKNATTTATWKFGIGDLPGMVLSATATAPVIGNLIDLFGPNIVVAKATNGSPEMFVTGFSFPDTLDIPKLVAASFDTSVAPAYPMTTGTFNMSFVAPDDDGIVQVAFEVPVVGFGDAAGDYPVVWYIRGGLNNGLSDAGISPAQPSGVLGGAVVLGFGNLSAFPIVNLHPKY